MATTDVTPSIASRRPADLVPRYVANLNAWAERFGMTTATYLDHYDDEPERLSLFADWSGTVDQLIATGLFVPNMARTLKHHQCKERGFRVPTDQRHPLLFARVTKTGENVLAVIHFEDPPLRTAVAADGRSEIAYFPDHTLWFGTRSDLIGLGIEPKNLAGRRSVVRRLGEYPAHRDTWSVQQPCGQLTYAEESEICARRRQNEYADRAGDAHVDNRRSTLVPDEWRAARISRVSDILRYAGCLVGYGDPLSSDFRLNADDLSAFQARVALSSKEILAALDGIRIERVRPTFMRVVK